MIKHIYLIRHGETVFNSEGKIQGGGLDSPLTENGVNQAKLLSEYLKLNSFEVDLIFSSPIERALQTARIVTSHLGKEIHLDPSLKEINCGEYEGRLIESIEKEKLRKLRIDPFEKYPSGECLDDVKRRAETFIKKLKDRKEESVLIFSHGNFLRAFACAATGSSAGLAMRIYLENTGFSYLFKSGDFFRIFLWNSTSHISPLPRKLQI